MGRIYYENSKSILVTTKQALLLREFGFDDVCGHFAFLMDGQFVVDNTMCLTKNTYESKSILAIPTTDQAIDWLRKKHDIIVCNKSDPYVCPKTGKIQFGYTIKKCYPKGGWNMRRYIGVSIWSANIYAAKRNAVRKALIWLKKEDAERRRASKTRRRRIRGKKNTNR